MLKTLVVESCEITGIFAVPATPKIVFPLTIFAASRFASPLMVCAPVRYVPDAMVWLLVPGVIVAAALVVTDAVSDTDELPAVPEEIYPALTVGVFETLFDRVSVFVPVDTDAPVAVIVDAGVAEPLDTVPEADEA